MTYFYYYNSSSSSDDSSEVVYRCVGVSQPCPSSTFSEESTESADVEEACRDLRFAFSPRGLVDGQAACLNFSDPTYRDAYTGRYLGSHLSVVQNKLDTFWRISPIVQTWMSNLEEEEAMYVCSIGGGPGTDILGTYLFMEENDMCFPISGTIFDCYNWERNFKALARRLDPFNDYISTRIHNVRYNFFEEPLLKNLCLKLRYADLVTMVKFISGIAFDWDACIENIVEIVNLMKPGAMIFFADNSGGGYYNLMQCAAVQCNLRLVARSIHQFIEASPTVINRLNLDRNCCYNCSPQVGTKVSAAMWQKCCW